MTEFKENNADIQYLHLLDDILTKGNDRGDRTGTGTRSIFGQVIRHDMKLGFPLITSKKMATKQMVNELWWLMSGMTNIKPMVDAGNYIWVGDAYKNYRKIVGRIEEPWTEVMAEDIENSRLRLFTRKEFIEAIKADYVVNIHTDKKTFSQLFGELGPVYGKQWRNVEYEAKDHLTAYNQYLSSFDKDAFYPQNCRKVTSGVAFGDADFESTYVPFTFEEFYGHVTTKSFTMMYSESGSMSYPVEFKDVYGTTKSIDQLQEAISKIKSAHEDRRIIVNSWNVAEIHKMLLPPCHYSFQFYVEKLSNYAIEKHIVAASLVHEYANTELPKEVFFEKHKIPTKKVSLMWNQRSVDTALGLPFNISSYALLLEIVCAMTNTIPNELIGVLGDTHLYNDHINIVPTQLYAKTYPLCSVKLPAKFYNNTNLFDVTDFANKHLFDSIEFENYESSPKIEYPLSN